MPARPGKPQRIQQLLELAKLGRSMLDASMSSARLDASWLTGFGLGVKSKRGPTG